MSDETKSSDVNFIIRAYRKTKRYIYLRFIAPNKKLFHDGASVHYEDWCDINSKKYLKRVRQNRDVSISGNIPNDVSLPNQSRAVDKMIVELSKNKNYGFANIIILVNPYQNAPLCAVAIFNTDFECPVHVKIHGKTEDTDIEYDMPKETRHIIPVLGLYSEYTNCVEFSIVNKHGIKQTHIVDIKREKLPGEQSEIDVQHVVDSDVDYRYDMTLVYGGDGQETPYAFDKNTDIRFSYSLLPKTYGFQPISDGRFLYLSKRFTRLTCTNPSCVKLLMADQLGRADYILYMEYGAHHDFQQLENGDYVMGSNSIKDALFEDAVIFVDHHTGQITRKLNLPPLFPKKYVSNTDWAHLNGVQYFPESNELLVSLRNLHSLVKIDCAKEEIKWILCAPQFWEGSGIEDKVLKPLEKCQWFFQQHAGYIIDNLNDDDKVNVILYDNHRAARVPVDYFEEDGMSHIMLFEIDEKNMTCRQLKNYPVKESNIRSNAVYETRQHTGFVKSDTDIERRVAEDGKVMAMSGKLTKHPKLTLRMGKQIINKFKTYHGEILQIDYQTGKTEHQFSTTNAFYRAYGMSFEPYALVKKFYELESLDNAFEGVDYMLGKVEDLEAISSEEADKILETSQNIKKKETNIKLRREEGYMQVKMIDHQLKNIYIIGKNHAYTKDYSGTQQERESFRTTKVYDTVSLMGLADDSYTVHFYDGDKLFNMGYKINISREK